VASDFGPSWICDDGARVVARIIYDCVVDSVEPEGGHCFTSRTVGRPGAPEAPANCAKSLVDAKDRGLLVPGARYWHVVEYVRGVVPVEGRVGLRFRPAGEEDSNRPLTEAAAAAWGRP
jgi:hypothetical protein